MRLMAVLILWAVLTACGVSGDKMIPYQFIPTYLVEVTAYNPGNATEETKYFSSGAYGYTTGPGDTPANSWYEPRVVNPGNFERSCFAEGATGGRSSIGYGEITLANADGVLDYLKAYAFDKRRVVVKFETSPGTFTTIMVGTMLQPMFSLNLMTIRFRDRLEELNKPVCVNKYLGNNSLPDGLEGVEDIKGKPKPVLIGYAYNITPTCVNTSRLIYQYNDGGAVLGAVYDSGVELTRDTDYTDAADMAANAPSAGHLRAYPAGGYFRLGSSPAGAVTCDAHRGVGANYTLDSRWGALIQFCALQAGVDSGDIVTADIDAINTVYTVAAGAFLQDENATWLTVLDYLMPLGGAWYGFDNLGRFRASVITAPSGTPVVALTDFLSLEVIQGERLPVYQVVYNFSRNYTIQTTDLAGAALPRRQFTALEYRSVTSTDASIQTKHPLATVLKINSPLNADEASAQAISDLLLALHKVDRERIRVSVSVDPETLALLDLGKVVKVQYPRFGFNAGKLFRIISIQPDFALNRVTMILWG